MPRPSHVAGPKKRRGIILQPELVVKAAYESKRQAAQEIGWSIVLLLIEPK